MLHKWRPGQHTRWAPRGSACVSGFVSGWNGDARHPDGIGDSFGFPAKALPELAEETKD
jgi:hypothetical protein